MIEKLKQNRKLIIGIAAGLAIVGISLFFLKSCNNTLEDTEEIVYAIDGQTADGFEDGTYCADVDYYNPNTGTKNRYTLQVEVQKNEVVKILFGNGGWLDSEHMKPQNVGQKGECIISTDRNYEYTIKIKGKDCGYSDNINPETDVDFPRYTFAECTQMLGMTQEEINDCLSTNYSESEVLSESGLNSLKEFINNMRAIHEQYLREIGQIQDEQNMMDNEIKQGYIQNVVFFTAHDNVLCHQIVVQKGNYYYWLEVRGNRRCETGTMRFDENSSGWQSVPVKHSPNSASFPVYEMKMKGQSSDLTSLNETMRTYCGL